MTRKRDDIFANPRDMIVDFRFDEQVAAVFPDMIRRSVPGYDTIIPLLGLFAERYAQPNSRLYDLGCSLGAATLAMRRYVKASGCRIIAVDNAQAMLDRCRDNLAGEHSGVEVSLQCADIQDVDIVDASLVVINFTLQFIDPVERQILLDRIYQGLRPGGALVIAEKITFTDDTQQQFEEALHLDYKRANGYSELEISQKRTALENVLTPESLDVHMQRAKNAGFARVYPWFQCFNFAALCALK